MEFRRGEGSNGTADRRRGVAGGIAAGRSAGREGAGGIEAGGPGPSCATTALRACRLAKRAAGELERAMLSFALASCTGGREDAGRQCAELMRMGGKRGRAEELVRRVKRTLGALDRADAALLWARFYRRKRTPELASALGVSARTVYRRLERAEEQFRARFESFGFSERFEEFLEDGWVSCVYERLAKGASKGEGDSP